MGLSGVLMYPEGTKGYDTYGNSDPMFSLITESSEGVNWPYLAWALSKLVGENAQEVGNTIKHWLITACSELSDALVSEDVLEELRAEGALHFRSRDLFDNLWNRKLIADGNVSMFDCANDTLMLLVVAVLGYVFKGFVGPLISGLRATGNYLNNKETDRYREEVLDKLETLDIPGFSGDNANIEALVLAIAKGLSNDDRSPIGRALSKR